MTDWFGRKFREKRPRAATRSQPVLIILMIIIIRRSGAQELAGTDDENDGLSPISKFRSLADYQSQNIRNPRVDIRDALPLQLNSRMEGHGYNRLLMDMAKLSGGMYDADKSPPIYLEGQPETLREKYLKPFKSHKKKTHAETTHKFIADPALDQYSIDLSYGKTQFWKNRDSPRIQRQVQNGKINARQNILDERLQKYEEDDTVLENLQPRPRCNDGVSFCAKLPLKYVECVLDCLLSNAVLGEGAKLKFLYRLLYVFLSYHKQLCPNFGGIYKKIMTVLEKDKMDQFLLGFLDEMGLEYGTGDMALFLKNGPSSLLINLALFGTGPDFDNVRYVIENVEKSLNLQAMDKNSFPPFFESAICEKSPRPTWFFSLIDEFAKRPSTSDILLKGLYVTTRALTQSLPYSTETIFTAFVQALKLMIGVHCSFISYAEKDEYFKCQQAPPIDAILTFYSAEGEKKVNPYPWHVCGAHQVEIPDFAKPKIDETDGSNGTAPASQNQFDLLKFPNPDELFQDYNENILPSST